MMDGSIAEKDALRIWNETANSDEFCAKIGLKVIRDTATGDAVMWRAPDGDYGRFELALEDFIDRSQEF